MVKLPSVEDSPSGKAWDFDSHIAGSIPASSANAQLVTPTFFAVRVASSLRNQLETSRLQTMFFGRWAYHFHISERILLMEPEAKPREIKLTRKYKPMVNYRSVCHFSIPVWWRRKLDIHIARGDGDVKVRIMFAWCKYHVFDDGDRFWGTNKWWFWDIG